ncbi:hypothetical protein ACP4OV_018565 [Aristida adscensionis]
MASGGGGRRRRRQPPKKTKKKTKYLSLSRHLIKAEAEVATPPPGDEPAVEEVKEEVKEEEEEEEEEEEKTEDGGDGCGQQQQFAPSTLFAAAPSLADILGAAVGGEETPSPSASPGGSGGAGFPGGDEGEGEEHLARRALRGRERWVYCSSSSSPATTATATATTTTSSSPCSSAASTGASGAASRSLLLKLDYDDILAAWAGRGSLYIGGAAGCPAAPEPELDAVSQVFVEVGPSPHAAAAAASPETAGPGRAERVRRYKEKRRSRLFEKRIRYEVRRVNAVKRPRFKGRFIKENEEGELQPS